MILLLISLLLIPILHYWIFVSEIAFIIFSLHDGLALLVWFVMHKKGNTLGIRSSGWNVYICLVKGRGIMWMNTKGIGKLWMKAEVGVYNRGHVGCASRNKSVVFPGQIISNAAFIKSHVIQLQWGFFPTLDSLYKMIYWRYEIILGIHIWHCIYVNLDSSRIVKTS